MKQGSVAPALILEVACVGHGGSDAALLGDGKDVVRIVLMTGFESFNVALYKKVRWECESLSLNTLVLSRSAGTNACTR